MDEPRIQRMSIGDLRPGPIRHDSLSDKLLGHIAMIHRSIGRYLGQTLEEMEIQFMRDAHPARESHFGRSSRWHGSLITTVLPTASIGGFRGEENTWSTYADFDGSSRREGTIDGDGYWRKAY